MSLEEKQLNFQKELEVIKNDCRNKKITVEQYLEKRNNLTKEYGFDKGSEYFRK